MGLSERRFGNYVGGRREPDLATLVKIASTLDTSPNGLLIGAMSVAGAKAAPASECIIAATRSILKAELEMLAVMTEALAKRGGGGANP